MRYSDVKGKTVYIRMGVCNGPVDGSQSPVRSSISWKVTDVDPARDIVTLRSVGNWKAHTTSLRGFMAHLNSGHLILE